jgi:hypothetical protein
LRAEPSHLRLGHGECATLRFHWSPSAPLDRLRGHPIAFVHLLDRPRHVLRTFDHPLPQEWRPGTPVTSDLDICQSVIGPALPAGTYLLTAGLVDSDWGYRWLLETPGRDVDRREYLVAEVEVPEGPAALVTRFSSGWGPPEPTGERQVLVRRRLRGVGTVIVRGTRRPGALVLDVFVPDEAWPGAELESGCTAAPPSRLPPGRHHVALDLPEGGECAVSLAPVGGGATTAVLEGLAWRARTEPTVLNDRRTTP